MLRALVRASVSRVLSTSHRSSFRHSTRYRSLRGVHNGSEQHSATGFFSTTRPRQEPLDLHFRECQNHSWPQRKHRSATNVRHPSTQSHARTQRNLRWFSGPHPDNQFQGHRLFSTARLRHDDHYDVTIVGGGMVGATLACCLGTAENTKHLRVAVLEPFPPDLKPLSQVPSIRASAVSPKNANLFQSIGAWQHMADRRVTSYTDMQVWHSSGRGRVHFKAQEMDCAALGYLIENNVIQAGLTERLLEMNNTADCGVELVAPASVVAIQQGQQQGTGTAWPVVELDNGQCISTRLLVGADGANSQVKKFSQVPCVGVGYGQRAAVATIKTEAPHNTAWQRFLPDGPVALLPAHGSYSNVVWSTSPAHAAHLSKLSPQEFLADLNNAFRAPPEAFHPAGSPNWSSLLPEHLASMLPVLFPSPQHAVPPAAVDLCGKVLSFPLRLQHALKYHSQRTVLVGDAAHVIHPMAGQGVNLGFGDAEALARAIALGVQTGQDIGESGVLDVYQSEAQANNKQMMAGVHAIAEIYGLQGGAFAAARGLGMDLFNSTPAVKRTAGKIAMGLV